MSSLVQLKKNCSQFIRNSLPSVRKVVDNLPTIPVFRAEPSNKKGRYKFIEEKQPNWWQLPKGLKDNLYNTPEARALLTTVENIDPFSRVISKWIVVPALERSYLYSSGTDIVSTILVSYLFASGCERWPYSRFNKVWNDCVAYFNPDSKTLKYCFYAPIAYMPGVSKKVGLSDRLIIRRLPVKKIARIASLDSSLSGISLWHRFTQWPVCFFEKRFELNKKVVTKITFDQVGQQYLLDWESLVSEEMSILRSLLDETPAVTTFSLIRDGYPRDPVGGSIPELPWRARFPRWLKPPSEKHVKQYTSRRKRFIKSHGEPGWESVAISMRKFAVAWENPFRADILADIVAALEYLVVRSNDEVSYKLRTRVSQLLGKSLTERQTIIKDLKEAYMYRSKVFHGGYVFDNVRDFQSAKRVRAAKGKKGNPFYDVNEVHRLIYTVASYYRKILINMIDRGEFEINWEERAL